MYCFFFLFSNKETFVSKVTFLVSQVECMSKDKDDTTKTSESVLQFEEGTTQFFVCSTSIHVLLSTVDMKKTK